MELDHNNLSLLLDGHLTGAARESLVGILADERAESSGAIEVLADAAAVLVAQARMRRPRRRRGPARRWCVPPAVHRDPAEAFEGWNILYEHEDRTLAALLWSSVRAVMLWAAQPDHRRVKLFDVRAADDHLALVRECTADVSITVPLTVIGALLGNPAGVRLDQVVGVCRAVAGWASERDQLATAVAYALAGAAADPADAKGAVYAGSLLQRWGRLAPAETWLRRGIGLARRGKSWEAYVQALVFLGELYIQRASPGDERAVNKARHTFVQAKRAGRRWGYLELRAAARHGLLGIALAEGAVEDAVRHAKGLLSHFPRNHPRRLRVLHDLARLGVMQGRFDRPVATLRQILPLQGDGVDRAATLALLARAAAGRSALTYKAQGRKAGRSADRRLYEQAWMHAWEILTELQSDAALGTAVLDLATAAAEVGDWLRLEQARRLLRPPRDQPVIELVAKLAARRA